MAKSGFTNAQIFKLFPHNNKHSTRDRAGKIRLACRLVIFSFQFLIPFFMFLGGSIPSGFSKLNSCRESRRTSKSFKNIRENAKYSLEEYEAISIGNASDSADLNEA